MQETAKISDFVNGMEKCHKMKKFALQEADDMLLCYSMFITCTGYLDTPTDTSVYGDMR